MEKNTLSGIMMILLVTAILASLCNSLVQAAPAVTIIIKADGSVEGTDKIQRDEDVYTFTDNVTCYEILVERSNIIIDGAKFAVEGNGTGRGFSLHLVTNVTIRNAQIKGFRFGISLSSATYNTIFRNNITNNDYGIWLSLAWGNSFSENNIIDNTDFGLYFGSSSNNMLSGNLMNGNGHNFYVRGIEMSHFIHSIDESNRINGKPVYYLVNQKNLSVSLATHPLVGFLGLINCSNAKIEGLTLADNRQGLLLAYLRNSSIADNNITGNYYGVWLFASSGNAFSGNDVTNNDCGVMFDSSSNNSLSGNSISHNMIGVEFDNSSSYNILSGNNVTANSLYGIDLSETSNFNIVSGNYISANEYNGMLVYESLNNRISDNNISMNVHSGIMIHESSNHNNVSGNHIENNGMGIYVDYSSNYSSISQNNITQNNVGLSHWESSGNTIFENSITHNVVGIELGDSSTSSFFHNNFSGNTNQVEILAPTNAISWDDGYPSGGNYWSDYTGVDSDGDGIGDTPYIIGENNQDNYPLMGPYSPPAQYTLTILSSPIEVTFTVDNKTHGTPWSGTYTEGSTGSLIMPETYNGYLWSHWLEDGDTNRIKTVAMTRDMTLTGVFAPDVPPTISVLFPQNKTYTERNVPLFLIVDEPTSWIGYSLDSQMNVTISGNTTLADLSDGVHSITVYANDTAGNMGASDKIHFTVLTSVIDTFPPTVLILSPQNETYDVSVIPLSVIVDEPASWMGYSLDNNANVTFSGDTNLSDLSDGSHSLTVYANDTAGNMGASETIFFRIDTPQPAPFPIWVVAAILVTTAFGTALYLLKIRKKS